MSISEFPDAFEQNRIEKGFGKMNDQNDPIVMVLRHKDVRKCAHQWQAFQSGATPGRIVVPSEEDIRDIRQIPFEVDPPHHGIYRALLEDWFRRPLNPDYEAKLSVMVENLVDQMLIGQPVEIVNQFALPLQSRALTLLLNIPKSEAETWISWGTHVFRSKDNPLDKDKANVLYDYIDGQIERAIAQPGEDLYSQLLNSEFEGRKLTKEEVKGVIILTFAGGRDTVINAVTNTIAYLCENPKSLDRFRNEPEIIGKAVEELVRYFSPLTHMGRVSTQDTQVCEHAIKKDSRISLCWASANRDASVFEKPNEVILDRKMNPHVGFGFSHHKCLGASHARQILKVLLTTLAKKVQSITSQEFEEKIEHWGEVNRKVGYDHLKVTFTALNNN